jgi:riboflavin kinase/FMN adenylyltransferase
MEKQHVAEHEGMDYYIQFPFTKETASMEPETFIQQILYEHLGAKAVVVGEDYAFGKMRKGNIETLEHFSKQYGYTLHALKKISYNNRIISSTWIREAIQEADMDLAETLMGRPYFVTGVVIEGAKLGRTIGYPTANVKPDGHKQLPRNGIYATEVDVLGRPILV